MSSKIDQIVESIKSLTLLEAADIAKRLKEELNLPDAAVAVAAGPAVAAAAVEEKTEFDVELVEFPADKKVSIIKVVREIRPELGLVEAKAFVEACPKVIKEGANKQESEEIKKKLEAAGAKVVIK